MYPLTADGNHGAFIREAVLRLRSGTRDRSPAALSQMQFSIFAPAYEGTPSYQLDDIPVHRFRYCPKRFENLVRDGAPSKIQRQPLYLVTAFFYIVLGACQLFAYCRSHKPSLLIVHWPFPHGLMALPVNKILGIPMLFSFHGGELLLAHKFKWVAGLLRRLLPHSVGAVANSSFTRSLVQQLYPGEVTVIPYGVTIEPKQCQTIDRTRQTADRTEAHLLFVGRLDERKGLTYLLDAIPLMLKKQPVRLRIVGRGILEADLRRQCQQMGLNGAVNFLGTLSKAALAEEYANCDVFVLPAIVDSKGDTEGLGVVLIEALSHQKLVVATQVGGIPDVITSGKTGVLVPEKDPQALAEAVLSVLANPQQSALMAQQGCEDVQTRFAWSRITRLWQQVIHQAISQPLTKRSFSNLLSQRL